MPLSLLTGAILYNQANIDNGESCEITFFDINTTIYVVFLTKIVTNARSQHEFPCFFVSPNEAVSGYFFNYFIFFLVNADLKIEFAHLWGAY